MATECACRSDSGGAMLCRVPGTHRFAQDQSLVSLRIDSAAALQLFLLGPPLVVGMERVRGQRLTAGQNHVNSSWPAPLLQVADQIPPCPGSEVLEKCRIDDDDI